MKKGLSFFVKCLAASTMIVVLLGSCLVYAQNDPHAVLTLGPFTWETTNATCSFFGGNTTTVTIDVVAVEAGDVIAAFVDADFVEVPPADNSIDDLCIGAIEVPPGSSNMYPLLNAWADDDTTPEKDGAEPNELVHFKIYDKSTGRILHAVPTPVTDLKWKDKGSKEVGLAAFSGISADVAGISKDEFVGENIYGKAILELVKSAIYPVYVVADKNNWAQDDALSGTPVNVTTDAVAGNIAAGTLLKSSPVLGSYDIVVDVNSNGLYDVMIDYLDDNVQIGAKVRYPVVNATANAGGTIDPAGPEVSVPPGNNQVFTICPDDCHNIKDVLVDSVSKLGELVAGTGRCMTYTFTNVTADHALAVEFEIIQYTITSSAGANGSISPLGAVLVDCGTTKEFTITPDNCYEIADVIVDAGTPGEKSVKAELVDNKYTFPAVTADHTIDATFVKMGPFTITPSEGNHGTISPSEAVEAIECGSNVDFIIGPNDCYHIADVLVDGTTSVKNDLVDQGEGLFKYTFTNVKANHTIEATFAINVYTIVASAGQHGKIEPSGNVSVNCGNNQTFVITADACYHVAEVLVDGIALDLGGSPTGMAISSPNGTIVSVTYTFENVRQNHTISASFAINEYTIAASAGLNGSISPSGDVTVNCDSDQLFTITPADCYEIDTVLVDDAPVQVTKDAEGVGTYSFANVTEDHTISADFKRRIYIITASADANGNIEPSGFVGFTGSMEVYCGDSQQFTMTPAANYRIKEVTVDGSLVTVTPDPVTDIGTYTFTNVRANHTISVTFEPKERTIVATDGDNGSIEPSGNVKVIYATDKTFTMTPASCYEIDKVLVDGEEVAVTPDTTGKATYTFTNVIIDHTINVTFKIRVYTITATYTGDGLIQPTGVVSVNCGTNKEYTITPADCYKINEVLVDGVSKLADVTIDSITGVGKYTFTNVTADHTMQVTFVKKQYIITASAGANGSISPNGDVTVICGSSQKFTITPNSCYEIDKVMVDNELAALGTDGTYTFPNVTRPHIIAATFKIKVYTITATAGTNGSISPNGAVLVNCGTNKAFTITPASCYEIDDVLVDGVSKKSSVIIGSTGVGTYTFNAVGINHTIHATFKKIIYTIVATAGDHGSISPSGNVMVECGSPQTFTITPASCYEIDKVMVDNTQVTPVVDSTGVGTFPFTTVTVNHTINATFKIKVYTITVTANTGGTVVPSGVVNVNCGDDQEFAITADSCYHIDDILVDGESKFNGGSEEGSVVVSTISQEGEGGYITSDVVNFYTVMKNHTLEVVFAINVYTITATAGDGGTIDPMGDVMVNCGSDQMFTIAPNDCYKIADVLVDGSSVMNSEMVNSETGCATYTFAEVGADHTIHAVFALKTYVIKATAGPNGMIDPVGDLVVNCGSDQKFMMVPNTDYHVKKVLVDGVSVGALSEYTFKNVKKDHTISVMFEINPIELMSASYDVPNTLLTLRFDRPVRIEEPYVPCFDCIGMEVDNSGLMDFALSSNPNLSLKDRVWNQYGNNRVVYIDINRAYTTTVNLAVAAFISHKADDIDLLLSCVDVFTGWDGAKTAKADVPLNMIVDGYILGIKGDVTGDGALQTVDAGNILKASVKGLDVLPIYNPGTAVDNILAGFGYAKCNTPLYTADWNGNNVVDSQDAADMLSYLADNKIKAPSPAGGPKIGKLSVNDYSNGKLNVSVDLDNSSGVYSADIVLAYDTGVLTVSEVVKAFATSGWLFEEVTEPGKVKIAMAGIEQPSEDGSLVDMTFDAASANVIGKIDIVELKLNGGNIKATIENLPRKFALLQNYPNPFNPETWLPYQLTEPCDVTITIYNANGQVVRRLELGNKMPGNYVDKVRSAYWDGSNEFGERVSSGIYFYQLQAGKDSSVRKMIIVK